VEDGPPMISQAESDALAAIMPLAMLGAATYLLYHATRYIVLWTNGEIDKDRRGDDRHADDRTVPPTGRPSSSWITPRGSGPDEPRARRVRRLLGGTALAKDRERQGRAERDERDRAASGSPAPHRVGLGDRPTPRPPAPRRLRHRDVGPSPIARARPPRGAFGEAAPSSWWAAGPSRGRASGCFWSAGRSRGSGSGRWWRGTGGWRGGSWWWWM
jgi:hypothetical protein